MEKPITLHSQPPIENEAFRRYAEGYLAIERDFYEAIGGFGLDVSEEDDDFDGRVQRMRELGVSVENDRKSFHTGWISPARSPKLACMRCASA